jgi:predicted nucleic acid-binding protein
MGLLRLLTNHHAMGIDVVGQVKAWHVYEELMRDFRVRFVPEPAGLEQRWQQFTRGSRPATNLWTDAYLAAFAQLRDLCLVSFDEGFSRRLDLNVSDTVAVTCAAGWRTAPDS